MLFLIPIKLTLYLYWFAERNPLLIKFLISESTAYFLDETFYHTHIPLFQEQFPLQQSLKPQNIALITSSIIHMT